MVHSYDVVTVGGGLAGAAFATVMARSGSRVLVLERETMFKDRVRGEGMSPWGTAEARTLGIESLLLPIGNELQWWDFYFAGQRAFHRDLLETTPQHCPVLTFFHPEMQETLLAAAQDAGADVRRGAQVRSVTPGATPRVDYERNGTSEEVACRLVVGADGRRSSVRRWARFEAQHEPDFLYITGVLLEGVGVDEHTLRMDMNLATGVMSFMNPQGNGRVRAYLVARADAELGVQGASAAQRFIQESVNAGVQREALDAAEVAGPVATFAGADSWVNHPYADGVVLVGDAAATSDPSWGQGLSLTLRDVRVLSDALLRDDDWERAGHVFAQEHDRYFGVSHTVNMWLTELFYSAGDEASAVRARALPLLVQDASRIPDVDFSGPDIELNETSRRRLFGEE